MIVLAVLRVFSNIAKFGENWNFLNVNLVHFYFILFIYLTALGGSSVDCRWAFSSCPVWAAYCCGFYFATLGSAVVAPTGLVP